MIDITKKYRTRDGHEVTGLHMRDSACYPVGGFINVSNEETWTTDGLTWAGCEEESDLIEVADEQPETELAELRAFRDTAIAKYPDLAPVDPIEVEVQRIYDNMSFSRRSAIRFALLRGIEIGKGAA